MKWELNSTKRHNDTVGRIDTVVQALTNLLFTCTSRSACFQNVTSVKYQKLKNIIINDITGKRRRRIMTYTCGYCDVQRERHRRLMTPAYRRPKWSEYYQENLSQLQLNRKLYMFSEVLVVLVLHVTISILLGRKCHQTLAVLLPFSIETVDWLDWQSRELKNKNN